MPAPAAAVQMGVVQSKWRLTRRRTKATNCSTGPGEFADIDCYLRRAGRLADCRIQSNQLLTQQLDSRDRVRRGDESNRRALYRNHPRERIEFRTEGRNFKCLRN